MQASFTPDEQDVIEKLRSKYAPIAARHSEKEEADVSAERDESRTVALPNGTSSRTQSTVDATVCTHCHGSGTLIEIYNHRRLERFCQPCDGRGVRVYKNGVEVKEGGGAATAAATSGRSAGPAGVVALGGSAVAGGAPAGAGDEGAKRVASVQSELQRIAAKTAEYAKERLDVQALLQQPQPVGGDPAGREQAGRDLLAQLDLQLERLELLRRKKTAALVRAQAAQEGPGGVVAAQRAGITLADVYANEGVRA